MCSLPAPMAATRSSGQLHSQVYSVTLIYGGGGNSYERDMAMPSRAVVKTHGQSRLTRNGGRELPARVPKKIYQRDDISVLSQQGDCLKRFRC